MKLAAWSGEVVGVSMKQSEGMRFGTGRGSFTFAQFLCKFYHLLTGNHVLEPSLKNLHLDLLFWAL